MKLLQCLLLLIGVSGAAQWAYGWDATRLATPVVINGLMIPYNRFAIYVMPNQAISVYFHDAVSGGQLSFKGVTSPVGGQPLSAPSEAGVYPLKITNAGGGEQALVHVFVMIPGDRVDERGFLNGYHIGHYPATVPTNPAYRPPVGFVEVTQANRSLHVSPNFRLGDFVTKQQQGYPKYIVLQPALIFNLENILATLNRDGIQTSALVIMSGYRTPWYNQKIGNSPGSQHILGAACDIYIDEHPRDGMMDDLNGDGRVDRADAQWLAAFIEKKSLQGHFGKGIGGLGVYGRNEAHGPFIHVDAREARTRW